MILPEIVIKFHDFIDKFVINS